MYNNVSLRIQAMMKLCKTTLFNHSFGTNKAFENHRKRSGDPLLKELINEY